jgi:hypothetical protein
LAIKKKILHHLLGAWIEASFTCKNFKSAVQFVDLLKWPAVWNNLCKISKHINILVSVLHWMKYQLKTNIHTSTLHWLLCVVDRHIIKCMCASITGSSIKRRWSGFRDTCLGRKKQDKYMI